MRDMLGYMIYLWRRLLEALLPRYKTAEVEEFLPAKLKRRTLYIVSEDGFEEQAAMLCPCGCGRTLHMNLLADERPCWRVSRHDDGSSSLHPSVWRKKDCKSHFWFRRGRVRWCRDFSRPVLRNCFKFFCMSASRRRTRRP